MTVIYLISAIIYGVAIVMIYHNIYYFEKNKKIKFITIGLICIFVLTFIICTISSSSIKMEDMKQQIKITKYTAILIFSPINSILLLPYIGNVLNKYKAEELTEDKIKKRFIIILIVTIILIILELGYFKNFELGILNTTRN